MRGRAIAAIACAIVVTMFSGHARAHEVGLSRGSYVLDGASLAVEITIARKEAIYALPAIDADDDGAISEEELAKSRDAIGKAFVDGVRVKADGADCGGTFVDARLTENDGLVVATKFACASPPRHLSIALELLAVLSHGHRHFAHVEARGATDVELYGEKKTIEVEVGAPSTSTSVWSLFRMGLEHILTGYDHLVFLFGLVLIADSSKKGWLRAIVGVVTSFTLGHSISLALATLGVWAPSPRIVEPAIAASIAYVGVENLLALRRANASETVGKRWRITFPFGLVHGFGFAGALQEIQLPRARLPMALFLFNVGVEAGQLAVLALLLPALFYARRSARYVAVGPRLLSVGIAIAGAVWFVSRVVHP